MLSSSNNINFYGFKISKIVHYHQLLIPFVGTGPSTGRFLFTTVFFPEATVLTRTGTAALILAGTGATSFTATGKLSAGFAITAVTDFGLCSVTDPNDLISALLSADFAPGFPSRFVTDPKDFLSAPPILIDSS